MRLLIAAGANVDAEEFCECTPLWFAVEQGHRKIVTMLVNAGANMNSTSIFGRLLHKVAVKNFPIFRYLVRSGANIEATDSDGGTVLHDAVELGDGTMIRFLLSRGIQRIIDRKDSFGKTPLYLAAKEGSLSIVQDLVRHGAHLRGLSPGFLPINAAAAQSHIRIVSFFLAHEPKCIDEPDYLGYTPLEWAVRFGQLEVVKFLLKNGAQAEGPNGRSLFDPESIRIINADSTIETDEETVGNYQSVIQFLLRYGIPLGTYGTRILANDLFFKQQIEDDNVAIFLCLSRYFPRDLQSLILLFLSPVQVRIASKRKRSVSLFPHRQIDMETEKQPRTKE